MSSPHQLKNADLYVSLSFGFCRDNYNKIPQGHRIMLDTKKNHIFSILNNIQSQ